MELNTGELPKDYGLSLIESWLENDGWVVGIHFPYPLESFFNLRGDHLMPLFDTHLFFLHFKPLLEMYFLEFIGIQLHEANRLKVLKFMEILLHEVNQVQTNN